ncbi:Beta-glucuronosyltransferase GlcAT14B, partial [Mucuna pruriens]
MEGRFLPPSTQLNFSAVDSPCRRSTPWYADPSTPFPWLTLEVLRAELRSTKTNKQQKKKWLLPLVLSLLLSTSLTLFSIFASSDSSSLLYLYRTRVRVEEPRFVESKLRVSSTSSSNSVPRIAYLISGSMGDGETLKRTLKALYHPRNQCTMHLDLETSLSERLDLANFVKNEPLFAKPGNVRMVVKANLLHREECSKENKSKCYRVLQCMMSFVKVAQEGNWQNHKMLLQQLVTKFSNTDLFTLATKALETSDAVHERKHCSTSRPFIPEMAESFRDVFKASGSGGLPSLKHIVGNVLIGTLSILETSRSTSEFNAIDSAKNHSGKVGKSKGILTPFILRETKVLKDGQHGRFRARLGL